MSNTPRTALEAGLEANRYFDYITPLRPLAKGVTLARVNVILDELAEIGDNPSNLDDELRAMELRHRLFLSYAPPSLSGKLADPPFTGEFPKPYPGS